MDVFLFPAAQPEGVRTQLQSDLNRISLIKTCFSRVGVQVGGGKQDVLTVVPWRRWWVERSRPVTRRRGRSRRWPGPGAAGRSSPPPRPAGTERGTEPCGPRCCPAWPPTWRTAPCSLKALQPRWSERFMKSGGANRHSPNIWSLWILKVSLLLLLLYCYDLTSRTEGKNSHEGILYFFLIIFALLIKTETAVAGVFKIFL